MILSNSFGVWDPLAKAHLTSPSSSYKSGCSADKSGLEQM